MQHRRFTEYLIARARETSTWQALILCLTAAGINLTEDQRLAILTVGLGLAGLAGALLPERLGKKQTRSTDDEGEKK